jgi:hypothetical protein
MFQVDNILQTILTLLTINFIFYCYFVVYYHQQEAIKVTNECKIYMDKMKEFMEKKIKSFEK